MLGCGPNASSEPVEGSSAKAPAKDAPLTGKLEVVAFQGGYGIDFYQKAAEEFAVKHPNLEINVTGNPRVWEQLRPRFVGGDPPDLVFPGWGMDHWSLAAEGQLLSLDEALDSPAFDGNGTWRETFEPELLKLGQLNGKQWVLPYYVMALGWWHDPKVFQANGWQVPATWEQLLALCEKIKAKNIAPITYQGKYPYYMIDGMLLPWAHSVGGPAAVQDAQDLVPGAWKSPAMLKAAEMIVELRDKGYLQKGATAMSHTEAQQEFLQGRAAMVPCGTWLFSEMRQVMPEGATMEFFLPPAVAGGKGDAGALLIGIEPWMIPSSAKNPEAAVALFKYMTSPTKAVQFVEQKGTLMSIRGTENAKLPEVLVKPAAAMRASKQVWAVQYRQWYPAFNTEIENALTAMLNGEATPQQFCNRVEAAAEKTRNDSSITRHKVSR